MQDCDNFCKNNRTCLNSCVAKAGDTNATIYWMCVLEFDCLDKVTKVVPVKDPQSCIEKNCPTQWAACQKDPKCQPALDDCMKKCGSKESCWTLCLSTKGSQAAIDTAKCGQANHCLDGKEVSTTVALKDPQQCIEQKCPNQWAACQKDPKCVPTLQECQNKCGTKQSCW